jgi:hypothetical protein
MPRKHILVVGERVYYELYIQPSAPPPDSTDCGYSDIHSYHGDVTHGVRLNQAQ